MREDISIRAIELRRMGLSFEIIAYALNSSVGTIYRLAKDTVPEWRIEKRKIGAKRIRRPLGLALPTDPALKRRLRDLARRGYDVPPSKQADWDNLTRTGIPIKERVRMLELE